MFAIITYTGTAATTAATPTPLYIKYNTGVYSDSAATASVTKITAPVLTGHSFLGFYTGKAGTGDLVVKPDGTFVNNIKTKYSSAGTTATWHAHYEPWTYKIVYNAWKPDTASSTLVGETSEQDGTYGVPITIKTQQDAGFELTGYDLIGWATSENSARIGAVSNSLGQVVSKPNMPENGYVFNLYPVWVAKTITLDWDENNGSAIANGTCKYDSTFTLPAGPTRTNYTFRTWQLANQNEVFPTTTHPCTVASFGAIDANNTAHGVRALWNGEKATVKFKTGDTVLDTKWYEYGGTYSLPDISSMSNVPASLTNANYGWTFVGWSTDYNSTTAEYTNKAAVTNLTGTITLYPVWKRSVQFTYYRGNTATTTTTGSADQYYRNTTDTAAGVTSVTTPTVAVNTTYGWTPVQWKLNDTSATSILTNVVSSVSPAVNVVSPHYYAVYRRFITLSYNGNGSTDGSVGSSTNYQYYNASGNGSNVAFTAASNGFTKTGYTFKGWAKTATGTDEFQPGDTYIYTNTGWTGSSTATLYAKWNPNIYRITLNNTTATSAVGVKQTLYTTYDDGVYLDDMHTKRMTTNSNPIAQLPSRQYTITYSDNGSTSTATAKYNFIGYATSEASGLTDENTAINSHGYITDVGLAAARSYTNNDHVWAVNWDDAGCIKLQTPSNRTGYKFAGWYTSDSFADYEFVGVPNATYCPTSTITLYGKWEPNVYKVTLADSVLDTTHNTIYEKYNTGWYSNAAATTKITSVPKPTRTGIDPHTGKEINYVFLGYFTTPQEDVNSTHYAPASLQRVDKNGNILPSNTSLTGNATWYAAWAEPCASVSHGTCHLSVSVDGSVEYTAECEEGYVSSGYGGAHPTCGGQMVTLVSDFKFHGETLNAKTEAAPKVIYLKPNDGYYTTSTGSTAVTDLTTLPELEHQCFTFNGFYVDQNANSIKRINADGTFVDNYQMLPTGPEGTFLYAGYTAQGFSTTYDLNGGEEVDDGELNISQTHGMCSFKMGDCYANQGSKFKKDGYILTGWKCYGGGTTACDGSDDDIYAPGAVITHVSNSCAHNPTFYAQWEPIESTITLNKNNVGSTDTNTGNDKVYTKYNWGAYLDSALTNDMSQTLRPITIPVKKFTVKYNANNDGTSPSTANVAYTFKGYYSNKNGVNKYIDERGYITTAGINEAKATVTPGTWYANWTSKSIDLPNVTRTGYQFNGWYKCSDTNPTIITSPFTPTENTELCAKWTANKYTVTFNANDTNDDATGTMDPLPMTYDVPAALTAEGFTNPGCTFTGWATSADGDVVYSDQQTVSNLTATNNGTVALYAKWDCMTASASNKTLTYNGTTTTNGTAQSCKVTPTVSNAPSNITVTYSMNKNSGFSATAPTLTNVGNGTIYYKVSATGYDDLIGSYTCTMQAKNMTVVANNITLSYTGSAQSCANENVKVTDPTDGTKKYSESATGPFSGTAPTLTNAGTKTIYYQVTGANYNTKTGSYTCTIEPIDNPITLSATSGSTTYPETKSITVSNAQGTVTATSSNTSIATVSVSSDGKTVTMTPVAKGNATITVSAAGNANYLSGSKTYALTVNPGTCILSVSPESDEITYPTTTATFTVAKGSCNGALSASSSATGVATVGLSGTTGTVTWKSAGTATIKVTAAATNQYNKATAEYTVRTKKGTTAIELSPTSGSVAYGATTTFNVTKNPSGGALSVSTSPSNVATATINGTTVTVTGVGYDTNGTATITVTSAETSHYLRTSATYKVTVNTGTIALQNDATTAGTTTIYTEYNTGVYNDSARKNAMSTSANGITIPAKAGYVFNGYYSATSGGTQYIDASGKITSNGLTAGKGYKTNSTWYAQWSQASCTVDTGVASATPSVANNTVTCAVTCSTGYSKNGGTDTTTTFNKSGSVNVATVATACSPRTFAIEYAGNNNTDGSAPTSPTSCKYDETCTAPDNTFTKTGYTFTGWKCTGGTSACDGDIISAGGSLKNVSTGSTITLTAQWKANSDTEYVVNHYTKNLGASTYTLNSTENKTGTSDASLTLASLKKSITGFTYSQGFAGTVTNGTTKPTIGAVTTTTILPDGTRVIDLYYNRNTYTITATAGHGVSTVSANGWTNTGTATMTKSFEYGAEINLANTIPADNKTGYTGKSYANSGTGTVSNGIFTVGNGAGTITVSATGIAAPTATITPASTDKIYNLSTTKLTGANSTAYDSAIKVYYNFGNSSSSTDTYTYGAADTTATTSVAADAYRGTKYYKVKIYATDGTLTSAPTESSAASVTLNNKAITFNATSDTLSGTSPLYVSYNNASVYTGATNTTAGTVPTATKTGYTFNGWYTAETGGSQIYNASGTLTSATVSGYTSGSKWVATGAKTLYAQWTANTYDVKYSCGDGTGTAPTATTATYGENFTPAANTCSKTGYTFSGWLVSGTSTNKAAGTAFEWKYTEDKTLTAQWKANKYAVKFNANDGSGTMNNQSFEYDAAQNLTANAFTNAGKEFKGWATSASGSVAYADKANVKNLTATANGTVNLYAVWASCPAGKYCPSDKLTPQDCPANAYCAEGSATPISCTTLGGGLYKNSNAGSTKAENCYITTTAGYYVANANDTTQTKCGNKFYCPQSTLYYPNVTGDKRYSCPNATVSPYIENLADMNWITDACPDATASNSTISQVYNQSWGAETADEITDCRAVYAVQTPCATFNIENAMYNSTTGAYDTDKGGRYSGTVYAGYYFTERYNSNYCNPLANGEPNTKPMYYRTAARCPENSYCPGGSVPKCNTGTYEQNWGKHSCAADTTHYTLSAEMSASINACYLTTESKKYVATAGAGQVTCSAGSYCAGGTKVYYDSTGGSTPCPAGSFCAAGVSQPTACVTGSYTATTGQSKCVACQSGTTTSGSGKTSCDATCANNNSYDAAWETASWSANSMTNLCIISKCGAGSKYASANGGSCTACGLGTYQSSTSHTNTTCSSAGSGYYVATEGASSQSACTSWRANTNTNGATGSTSTSACVCKSGMYLNSSNTCEACAAGTYKSANSNAACTVASLNYYVDGTGKTSQSACSTLGSFYTKTQSTGSTSDKCYGTTTAGKYIKTAQSSTQETCAAGSYCPATTVFYGGYDTTGGRKACPSGYDDGGTGYSQQSQCTIACSAGTRVETANATCTTPSGNWYVGANTVTYGKTTSVNTCTVGTNIFNPASYDVFWGWVNSSKEIRSYAYNAYVYVPVEPNTTYIVSGMGDAKTENGRGVALFSAKPVHGAYALGTASAGGKGKGIMVTTTADTKYLGVFVLSDNDGANSDTREAKVAANVVNLQIFKANSGYGIIGNAATDHDASTDCTITCGPGEYIATANAACTNVGAGYYFAGGKVSQGSKNTRGQCTAPLTTIGYGVGANEADDCGRKLHAGDNTIYLRSAERSTPSLRVKVGDKTFYGALSTSLSGALKVKKDNIQYSVVNDWQ